MIVTRCPCFFGLIVMSGACGLWAGCGDGATTPPGRDGSIADAGLDGGRREPDAAFRQIAALHRALLAASLVTVAGAVAGSHGYFSFG